MTTHSRFEPGHAARTLTAALAVVALSACCSAGRANEPAPDRRGEPVAAEPIIDRVRALLSGYEHVPTGADWARVGPSEEVAAALMSIASEANARTITAARATSSLAYFPRPEVAGFLEARVGDERLSPSLRGKSAIALAAAFKDERADRIAVLFASEDEGLREDGVRAFRHMLSPAAETFLAGREPLEPNERLRGEMANTRRGIATRRVEAERAGGVSDAVLKRPAIADPGPVRR